MGKVKVVLIREGVRELLRSEEIQTELKRRGQRVQEAAGAGYEMDARVGVNRANVQITAKTFRARKSNLKHNTLLKALNAARGD